MKELANGSSDLKKRDGMSLYSVCMCNCLGYSPIKHEVSDHFLASEMRMTQGKKVKGYKWINLITE